LISVVIAAHNEARVIGRCLDALAPGSGDVPLDITVVANGCTDDTAAVARARAGVRVRELDAASKPAALNAGDAAAVGFPRIYLDADIVLSGDDVRRLAAVLDNDGPVLAAVPRRHLVVTGRPLLVRAYYAVHVRLPVFRTALFGRGAIAVSATGRARFDQFPDMVADDLFIDSLFAAAEKVEVTGVSAQVATPLRTGDLVRRLSRVRAGNASLRSAVPGVRPTSRLAWLRHVVLPRPWLAPAAVCYVGITLTAAVLARRRGGGTVWGRDESSRVGAG
jgi:glycosyltransferase involved in cell wall biosynthesis